MKAEGESLKAEGVTPRQLLMRCEKAGLERDHAIILLTALEMRQRGEEVRMHAVAKICGWDYHRTYGLFRTMTCTKHWLQCAPCLGKRDQIYHFTAKGREALKMLRKGGA